MHLAGTGTKPVARHAVTLLVMQSHCLPCGHVACHVIMLLVMRSCCLSCGHAACHAVMLLDMRSRCLSCGHTACHAVILLAMRSYCLTCGHTACHAVTLLSYCSQILLRTYRHTAFEHPYYCRHTNILLQHLRTSIPLPYGHTTFVGPRRFHTVTVNTPQQWS